MIISSSHEVKYSTEPHTKNEPKNISGGFFLSGRRT